MNIEIEKYLQPSLELNEAEKALQVELLPQVPQVIVDIHTHIGVREDAVGLDSTSLSNLITAYPYFPLENHIVTRDRLWRDKNVSQVVFCFPFRGIDFQSSNEYVRHIVQQNDSFIPFLTGDPHNISYTLDEIQTGFWRGVKMYPEQLFPPAKKIEDFFPPDVLDEMDRHELPAMVHLPGLLSTDFPEVVQMAERHPNVQFIIAHFGMVRRNFQGAEQALLVLKDANNVSFEVSWYSEENVMTRAFEIVGPERILYGSDQPLNLIRAGFFEHPELGIRVLTDLHYHWVDAEEQRQYREISGIDPSLFPNMHFKSLKAVVDSVWKTYGEGNTADTVFKQVFQQNAIRILGGGE